VRIFVLGAYGMLGHALVAGLDARFELFASCRRRLGGAVDRALADRLLDGVDAEAIASVTAAIDRVRPAAVINCVGIVKQLPEAQAPIPSLRINALFPHLLAEACRARAVRLIHFSTDCVFSGRAGGYADDAVSDADDLYGRTKYLGEVGAPGCLTLRTSIIGPEIARPPRPATGLLAWLVANRGRTVPGYRRALWSGFTTREMARIVARVLTEAPGLAGVYNVAAAPIAKLDLLALIDARLGLGVTLVPDDEVRCDRSLDGARFARATGYAAPSYPDMIAELAS
jgi:dTDP-4-dehydrorhamnose reductase